MTSPTRRLFSTGCCKTQVSKLADIFTFLSAPEDSGKGEDSSMCLHVLVKPKTTAAL